MNLNQFYGGLGMFYRSIKISFLFVLLLGFSLPVQSNDDTVSAVFPSSSSSWFDTALSYKYMALTGAACYGWYRLYKAINTDEISPKRSYEDHSLPQFPKDFLWGVATSAYQVEGDCNNTWTEWEKVKGLEASGKACEHKQRYKEDVQLIKALGVNAYRFSINGAREPEPGTFNEKALAYYENLCDELIKNGIKPCITLHHYTDPLWFAALGGFEKEENIGYFVEYCLEVFNRLHNKVHLWFTFNSPDGYAAKGYLRGETPPGKKDMHLMVNVYANLLKAHVRVYRACKKINNRSLIGILKNIYQLDPWYQLNPLDLLACLIGRSLMDTCFFNFFTTGNFYFYLPGKAYCNYCDRSACKTLDFIGINYYAHTYLKNFKTIVDPSKEKTDNSNYVEYPEGIYRAIKQVWQTVAQPLNIPIYITENGIATTDDAQRARFTLQYLTNVARAISEGCNVQGYIHWSFMDNYEWGTYAKKYGLYAVDFATQQRTLKPGSKMFMDIVALSSRQA